MSSSPREVIESPLEQGVDEEVPYRFDFAPCGIVTAAVVAVVVTDVTGIAPEDVTAIVMPSGSHTPSGATITCKPLKLLTAGRRYKLECRASDGSLVRELYAIINATE